jgi:hypothetical protein
MVCEREYSGIERYLLMNNRFLLVLGDVCEDVVF